MDQWLKHGPEVIELLRELDSSLRVESTDTVPVDRGSVSYNFAHSAVHLGSASFFMFPEMARQTFAISDGDVEQASGLNNGWDIEAERQLTLAADLLRSVEGNRRRNLIEVQYDSVRYAIYRHGPTDRLVEEIDNLLEEAEFLEEHELALKLKLLAIKLVLLSRTDSLPSRREVLIVACLRVAYAAGVNELPLLYHEAVFLAAFVTAIQPTYGGRVVAQVIHAMQEPFQSGHLFLRILPKDNDWRVRLQMDAQLLTESLRHR
ncbi:hypothetical protein BJF78_07375 [Pseudonocardia sp. CNS-139]|nr:hypothetical protein BJF78_07375 [Pseudonocardia sp. CNS-139]